jgi:uncharacterized repeat protein (TIGR01451 family)
VLDRQSGAPLENAAVRTESGSESVRTGANGAFSLVVPLATGVTRYGLVASREGYEDLAIEVTLSSEPVQVVLAMEIREEAGPPGSPSDSIALRVTVDTGARCVAPGDLLEFHIEARNTTSRPLTNLVFEDSLEAGFQGEFQRGLESSDVRINEDAVSSASLEIHPDGRSFRLELGQVNPTGDRFVPLFTVGLPAATHIGLWCNRAVTRIGDAPFAGEACITTPLVFAMDISNEDGTLVGGIFKDERETFSVGDGGPTAPDSLVYEVVITNSNCYALTNVTVTDSVGASRGIVEFREAIAGYPAVGTLQSFGLRGFVWSIGGIEPNQRAMLLFRAEAVERGQDVNAVHFRSHELPGEKIDEESTVIQ